LYCCEGSCVRVCVCVECVCVRVCVCKKEEEEQGPTGQFPQGTSVRPVRGKELRVGLYRVDPSSVYALHRVLCAVQHAAYTGKDGV
jgi:hypothetical protein